MNFQIQQTFPSPTQGFSNYNTLTYIEHINSLVLYGQQKIEATAQGEPPKKKIAFKASKTAEVPTADKISVYSIEQRRWSVIEAKGKIPSSRSQFQCIYLNPCVIMYGGKVNGKNVNQVYALNCSTWTWKKLFSLDGPAACDQAKFFKISNTSAGLIASNSLWLLHVADVKWQLASNELPGSVWQKLNITLPQNIQFCWPKSLQNLLVVGEKVTLQINLQSKQKVRQYPSQIISRISKNELKVKYCLPILDKDGNLKQQSKYCLIINQNFLYGLKTIKASKQQIQLFNWQNLPYIQLTRQLACCALVQQNNTKQLFYLDKKSQLICLRLLMKQQIVVNSARILAQSQMLQNNSCIEEQDNQQSSLLVPSTNSRIKIENNQSQQLYNSKNQNYENQNDYNDQLIDSRVIKGNDQQPQHPKNNNYRQNVEFTKMTTMSKKYNQSEEQNQVTYNEQISNRPSKPETSRKYNFYNINSSQSNTIQRMASNQRFKYKTEEHIQPNQHKKFQQKSMEEEGQSPHQTSLLKSKLQNILYNESIKRKLLQSKAEALQNIIKKSQKFVLMLCKYGNNSEKQKHIQKVKQIRQQLQWNWSKQVYYRKQMQMNKMPSQLSQQIQQTMSHIQY